MNLCKYKNIFGKPRTGVHSLRLFDFAIVDVLFTIIASFIFYKLTRYSFVKITMFLFLLGILMHRLFCVKTKLDIILFN